MTVNELIQELMRALQKKQINGEAQVVVNDTIHERIRYISDVKVSESIPNEFLIEV